MEGHDPSDHADAVLRILGDPVYAAMLGADGASGSLGFTWDATTARVTEIYRDLVGAAA